MDIARDKAAELSKTHSKSALPQFHVDEKPPNKAVLSRSATLSGNINHQMQMQQTKSSTMELMDASINDAHSTPASTDEETDQSSQSSLRSPPQTTMNTVPSGSAEKNHDYKYQSRHSQK